MKTSEAIYLAVIGILLLVGISFLVLYYLGGGITIKFKEKIDSKTITYESDKENFWDLTFELGTVEFDNSEGVFNRKYDFPNFIGCIVLKENSNYEVNRLENIDINYILGGMKFPGKEILVPSGDKKTYKIIGNYNHELPWGLYDNQMVDKVFIYDMGESAENPLEEIFGGGYSKYGRRRCFNLINDVKPTYEIDVAF